MNKRLNIGIATLALAIVASGIVMLSQDQEPPQVALEAEQVGVSPIDTLPVIEATTTTTEAATEVSSTWLERPTVVPAVAAPRSTTTTQTPKATTTAPAKRDPLSFMQGEIGKRGAYADQGFWCHLVLNEAFRDVSGFTPVDSPSGFLQRGSGADAPTPGMVALLQLSPKNEGPGQVSHVGLVAEVTSTHLVTIERSPGGGPDVVVKHTRSLDDPAIVGFAAIG